jgi:hypothetical protein
VCKKTPWRSALTGELSTDNDPVCGAVLEISRIIVSELNGVECLLFDAHFGRFESQYFMPLQEQGMSMLRAILTNPKRELETTE